MRVHVPASPQCRLANVQPTGSPPKRKTRQTAAMQRAIHQATPNGTLAPHHATDASDDRHAVHAEHFARSEATRLPASGEALIFRNLNRTRMETLDP